MDVKLVIRGGKNDGTIIDINRPSYIIGRSPECNLRLESRAFSRKHAEIIVKEGYVGIKDLGSTNGTFLDGHKLTEETELKNGQIIKIGPLECTVQISAQLSGKKKPKVESVQDAVSRLAASQSAQTAQKKTAAKDDDVDLAELFGEDTVIAGEAFKQSLHDSAEWGATQLKTEDDGFQHTIDSRDAATKVLEAMFKNSIKNQ